MAKRFTDSEKWRDKWFRTLRPEFKLAWLYLLDNCDCAGVIDLDRELADFQLGIALDWDAFMKASGERIERLSKGKLWLVRFVEFQYGSISEDCRPHFPVISALKKYGLYERVSKGYLKGIQALKEQEQEKDKEQDKEKDNWEVPENLDCPQVRLLLAEFAKMRSRIKKPIRDFANSSLVLKRFSDREHLIFALETCIANDYQGLKTDYRPDSQRKKPSPGVTYDPSAVHQQNLGVM